ncbi:ABC transporter permease [Leucobacter celer]|uniref:ABC transporter permease n=1 Tax=Leucobacter celer TaxID=668625 RepID=UPI0006A77263|nr:ABC transporter permease [Leucobacter celer]
MSTEVITLSRGSSEGGLREFSKRYRWIGVRLLISLLILFIVSLLIFLVTIVLPGDAAAVVLGADARPGQVEVLREQMGLNLPLWQQYANWIGGVLTGNPGTSLTSGEPIGPVIAFRAANTFTLMILAAAIGLPIAFIMGVLAAVKPKGFMDGFVNIISVVIASLPEFVIGIFLVLLLSLGLFHVLPATSPIAPGAGPFADPILLVLPVLTLVIALLPYTSRQMRASMLEVLDSEYVLMAEVKGLPRRLVIFRHALRNAIIPGIQAISLSLAYLLGGTVIIEYLFNYPGLGSALTQAVGRRDIPSIQAIVLIFSAGIILFNLLADIFTVVATPKLRTK